MLEFFLNNIDILFTLVICCLYLINIFLVHDLLYRFLIFLGSMFVGMVNYAFILNQQKNFLMFLFLNCFFILLVFGILLYTKLYPQILRYGIEKVKNNSKILINMILFFLVFVGFSFVFTKISLIKKMPDEVALVVENKMFVKLDDEGKNVDVKNEILNQKNGAIDYYYIKTSKHLDGSNFLIKYNSILMLYIIYVLIMCFLSKIFAENER